MFRQEKNKNANDTRNSFFEYFKNFLEQAKLFFSAKLNFGFSPAETVPIIDTHQKVTSSSHVTCMNRFNPSSNVSPKIYGGPSLGTRSRSNGGVGSAYSSDRNNDPYGIGGQSLIKQRREAAQLRAHQRAMRREEDTQPVPAASDANAKRQEGLKRVTKKTSTATASGLSTNDGMSTSAVSQLTGISLRN